MRRQFYFPLRIGNQVIWLRNFKGKLALRAAELGLVAGDVTARSLDVDNAVYALEAYREALASFKEGGYALIDTILYDPTETGNIAWLPFALPAGAPATVPYGVLKRVFDYIGDEIKKSGTYTLAIGQDLGVEGPVVAAPEAATTTPDFDLGHTTNGKMEVIWEKGQFDGVKLEFDLGPAGLRSEVDLRPNYTLNWLPAAGTSAIIRVRLQYIYKGEEFGNWSTWEPFTLTA